ncbi:AAA-associated domain-containing protein [Fervidicoccus fontis]|uniref:AAA-associated domain-containing protein n=1 Tax=Fervidicoccus fontis TaxID=683846 RepID=UPI002352EE96|nr:AAA-associated domain-containing protein [Fervidicoccus fontis]
MNIEKEYVLPVSPKCISVDHVLGLVESLYSVGGMADVSYINDVTDVDIDVLPHAIDISERLGLISYNNGDLLLTDFGKKIAMAHHLEVRDLLKEKISTLQPIKDIIKKSRDSNNILTEDEVYQILSRYYGEEEIGKALKCISMWLFFFEIAYWDYEEGVLVVRNKIQ